VSRKKNQATTLPTAPVYRILAIETATDVSSIALHEGGKLVALQENHANRTHAKLVTVMIDRLLKDLELRPSDLAAVVVAKGPGSYTGLRVGVSVAKGLCMALDIPLLSLGSLDALAHSVLDMAQVLDAQIVPMIDARRMEVFCATFDKNGHRQTEVEAKIIEDGAFQALLDTHKVIFLGDGAEKCRLILEQHPNAIVLGNRLSSAAHMGAAAYAHFINGTHENLVTFEPFYLKEFVATLSTKKIL
jgi:tRNA threonylcarbamoyladenosine biosynthesis protein TsaB